jgi:hypothetical protein
LLPREYASTLQATADVDGGAYGQTFGTLNNLGGYRRIKKWRRTQGKLMSSSSNRSERAKSDRPDADDQSDNYREFLREPVRIPAELLVSQGYRFKVSVLDLSPSGFRIETSNDIPLERKVYLTIPGFQPLQARVAWNVRDQFGCEFSQKLHSSVFGHISRTFPSLIAGVGKSL